MPCNAYTLLTLTEKFREKETTNGNKECPILKLSFISCKSDFCKVIKLVKDDRNRDYNKLGDGKFQKNLTVIKIQLRRKTKIKKQ